MRGIGIVIRLLGQYKKEIITGGTTFLDAKKHLVVFLETSHILQTENIAYE